MKALELTVYPAVAPDPSGGQGYTRMSPNFRAAQSWRAERSREEQLKWRKRLTDAELAAEHHAAQKACWKELAVNQYAGEGAHSDACSEQWAAAVQRFATLPHYDEVTA